MVGDGENQILISTSQVYQTRTENFHFPQSWLVLSTSKMGLILERKKRND